MNEQGQNNLLAGFLEFVRLNNLFGTGDRILLAVSGGMDSMVMASLFQQSEFEFGIAHFNFSLRGDESEGDEDAVRNLAGKFGVEFHSKKYDTAAFAKDNKLSIQDAARKLRYEWFNEICDSNGYDRIATAHHHDDSIETFVINLMRGSGPAGLRGVPVRNGNVVRPLLYATREEISDYAKREKVFYRTDSSNETDDYLRNRIRHHLLPVFASLDPGYRTKFRGVFENVSFLYEYAMSSIDRWKRDNTSISEVGDVNISLDAILLEEDPVQFLSFLLYTYGIRGLDARKVLGAGQPGKTFTGPRFQLLRDREFLVLRFTPSAPAEEYQIDSLPATISTTVRKFKLKEEDTFHFLPGSESLQADLDKLSFPLTIRPWQAGDSFQPLGMKGRKKVSDFFVDKKLSLFEKENTFLLLSGNDIVCILGHRIDERFKVTPDTKRIITIEQYR